MAFGAAVRLRWTHEGEAAFAAFAAQVAVAREAAFPAFPAAARKALPSPSLH